LAVTKSYQNTGATEQRRIKMMHFCCAVKQYIFNSRQYYCTLFGTKNSKTTLTDSDLLKCTYTEQSIKNALSGTETIHFLTNRQLIKLHFFQQRKHQKYSKTATSYQNTFSEQRPLKCTLLRATNNKFSNSRPLIAHSVWAKKFKIHLLQTAS
jgi:hypothetical protein